jgi:orotate phosphoribosyltransferase
MEIEKIIADQLLKYKAVKLSPDKPFTWASGWKSPIYCDNRKILSYPEARKTVVDAFVKLIKEHYNEYDVIAGVATGAIAYGALVADILNKPFIYVRPAPKDHGLGSQIEGDFEKGAKVIVIEDLISTGSSSLSAVDCLLKNGANVLGIVAIFSYNFIKAITSFEKANVELYSLSHYDALLDEAVKSNYIKSEELETLKKWRINPELWGK